MSPHPFISELRDPTPSAANYGRKNMIKSAEDENLFFCHVKLHVKKWIKPGQKKKKEQEQVVKLH